MSILPSQTRPDWDSGATFFSPLNGGDVTVTGNKMVGFADLALGDFTADCRSHLRTTLAFRP